MAMKWDLESDISNKTMEETLIEVFGCISPDKDAKINKRSWMEKIRTEFYLAGNAMEMMIIEIFGCSSSENNAIKLENGKAIRKNKEETCSNNNADELYIMSLPVSA